MLDRRALLAAPLALAACERFAEAQTPARDVPGLKTLVPFPIGTCIRSDRPDDPQWVSLATKHVSQLTPEWEMKMEYILANGLDRPQFDRPDAFVAFAARHAMRLHGHALIWYSQGEEAFAHLDRARFAAAFDAYIATVAGRYRGKVVSWDVVNEPVTDAGDSLRDCHWSRALGQDGYIIRAFEQARAADPDAVLFLNDYNLENTPRKGATFLKLVERLMKAGAPIGGIGSQSHLDIEIPAGQIRTFMRDAASLGLPIHISELDASLRSDRRVDLRSRDQRLAEQTGRVGELAEAFMALPARQRFAFTVWGLRDTDSWLRQGERDDGQDQPLPFDAAGRPNPMFDAMAGVFTART
ncbi:endo-1,4-beta-xylanase [Brevundimonas sp.]|jgi:endo-1,4-beta-xylanase|uniref:endo-1,4-beta-xylanase n=1 Tax=Brevundimonas sp. TaxID=1871086 RepID=UPI0037848D76